MNPTSARKAPARAHAQRRSREVRTEQILKTARDLFGERGYDGATVAEIAKRVGVVEGLVFKYFPTKRQLMLEVLGFWYEEMFGDYTRELADLEHPRDRLRYLVWRHICTVRDYPRLCGLMFREVVSSEHDYRDTPLYQLNRRYTKMLVDTLKAGADAGDFRNDLPPQLVRSLVYGGIQHETSSYVASFIVRKPSRSTAAHGPATLDVDRLADQITALLCEGLQPAMSNAGTPAPTEIRA